MLRLYPTSNSNICQKKIQILNVGNAGLNFSGMKRALLSDHKPMTDMFTPKSLFSIFLRSILVPTNVVLLEYNKFLMEQEQKFKDGVIDEMEEFDWNSVLTANYNKFLNELCRLFTATGIKKVLEDICIENYSLKIADKLTKDVYKSALRKAQRQSDKLILCKQIFYTSLWGTVLGYGSFVIYDIGQQFVETLQKFYAVWKKQGFLPACKQIPVGTLTIFGLKRILISASCWASSSLGYAVGCYVNVKYGGILGSTIFDLLAGMIAQQALSFI